MNERDFGARVKRNLDASLADLAPEVLQRLETAREAALARARQAEAAHGVTWSAAGARLFGDHSRFPAARRYWLPAAALVAGIAVIVYWNAATSPQEPEDVELLSGELPLNAYLDRGFDQWLTDSSQR
ncbi:MAG: DUF3619 family protein [Burkholderiales bacterium]|nr:DUF3619 family protein [Burkholderiales bacterium]